jgi:hypothetical protein
MNREDIPSSSQQSTIRDIRFSDSIHRPGYYKQTKSYTQAILYSTSFYIIFVMHSL